MAKHLVLSDSRSRIVVAPDEGAALVSFEALLDGGTVSVLRSWQGAANPFDYAMNVLLPFSNRIRGAGFYFENRFHAVPPNLAGESLPIHGDAFQRTWSFEQASETQASLTLDNGKIGPFQYQAQLLYRLVNGTLSVQLTLQNTGVALPFGAGFHPWLYRDELTQLAFEASDVWLEDSHHLPLEKIPIASNRQWNYLQARALPDNFINNAFTAWTGKAVITQPTLGIDIHMMANKPLDTCIVYSPGSQSDFFCFEPVTHPVDAYNLPGQPGLEVLETNARMVVEMNIGWDTTC